MPHKATTVRLEPTLQQGLETLGKVLKRTMNQLVNEAVSEYVARRTREVEHEMHQTLSVLRTYRRRDPQFKGAIAAAAKAEANQVGSDPLDGAVVRGELVDGGVRPETGSVAPFDGQDLLYD